MKGLELAYRYYREVAAPALKAEFHGEFERLAFGLVGPGSECYGYDDELSRDHDWGPKVCVWVPEKLFLSRGEEMQRCYEGLPGSCCGFGPIERRDTAARRDGILSTPRFYAGLLGMQAPPTDAHEWLLLRDEELSLCSNGRIFSDPYGEFSGIREVLLGYYPQDVWMKKIVSRCVMISQHGQYNLWRSLERGDLLAVGYNIAMFTREIAALAFLLARSYRPFYKWQFRALAELVNASPDGGLLHRRLRHITKLSARLQMSEEKTNGRAGIEELEEQVEGVVSILAEELRRSFDLRFRGNFIQDAGFELQKRIEDDYIRAQVGYVE